MKLYNTLTQKKETFQPREGKPVSIYVCGITPYDTTHIGHAFTYVSMDNLIRYLKFNDLKVRYVQNVTDIDDDILRKSKETGSDWQQLGNDWTNHFIEDMRNLNVMAPDEYPRATDVIPDIIELIQQLLDAGVAYENQGNVYYAVDKWPEFGILCHLDRKEMLPIANERGNHPDDPYKRNPLDFVLWQAAVPGEPSWPSPWGKGRPGWHIECSAMVIKYLGPVIDIHSGGMDLCFPHHEAEIAQVLPLTGNTTFVRYWMHVAMVRYQGEKMSKSLGNLVMVSDLLQKYSADDIRLYLASHHYRDSWSYNEKDLQKAASQVKELDEAIGAKSGAGDMLYSGPYMAAFIDAMDDDLDTKAAISVIIGLAGAIKDGLLTGRDVKEAQETLQKLAGVLGLRLNKVGVEKDAKKWTKYRREPV